MAVSAIRGRKRRSSGWMRRIRSLLPIRHVAGRAGRGKPKVISDRGICMALLALHYSVRAEQRKSVKVLLHRLGRYPPAENRVALGAVGAELAAVNVSVTIGAILSNVSENRSGVASRASDLFVHATKRVPRGVVIELGNGANGGPACVCVAIFTGKSEGTMRTSARLPLGDCGDNHSQGKHRWHEPPDNLEPSGNNCLQRL